MTKWYRKSHTTNRAIHVMVWEGANGPLPAGYVIDHIDGNVHNNDLYNLRLATHSQNGMNAKLSKANKVGLKGICWDNERQRFMASIKVNRKAISKRGDLLTVAAWIINKRRELHGEFARFR